MEPGHNKLQGAYMFGGMDVHRDAPAVIFHPDHVIALQHHEDRVAVALHGLVDGIVHHLVYQVVKAVYTRSSYVHARPLTDGLQTLEDLDMLGGIILTHGSLYPKGEKKFYGLKKAGVLVQVDKI
jgi:hypothetical protein